MLRGDVKKPSIHDDVQQAPDEESMIFNNMSRRAIFASTPPPDEQLEVRQSLLAAIEDQHDQLHAQIERNRKVLMEHIDRLTWPCQQAPRDSVNARAPPDTYCTANVATQPDLSEVPDPKPITQSACSASTLAHEPISGDVGSAIADLTGLRTGPNESKVPPSRTAILSRLNDTKCGLVEQVGCGQFETRFDFAVCALILVNIVVIAMQLQWEGHKAYATLELTEDSDWDGGTWWFDTLEHVFTILFLLELLVRIKSLKVKYFADSANLFDAFLVLSSIVELYILTPLGMASGMNLTMLRIIRLCKIVRVLRVVRVMKLFLSLHIIGSAIIHSMSSCFWSIVVMFIVILMGGLFMSQNLSEYIMDEGQPLSTRKWVYKYYGGSARATLTMFEMTLSGCWPNYSRRLIEEVNGLYVVFFVVYITGVVFAVTRITTAIFLRDTLHAANTEADRVIIEMKHQRRALMCQLEEFFREADESSDGLVDRDEFERMLQNPNVRSWLKSMGLVFTEYAALFNLIDDGSGSISFHEFLDGVNRLKGYARSVDILSIALELGRVRESILEFKKEYDWSGGKRMPA